jgi:hypothetical protein
MGELTDTPILWASRTARASADFRRWTQMKRDFLG